MKEVKYFCDICNIEVPENDMGHLQIRYERNYNRNTYQGECKKYIEICESCVSEIVDFYQEKTDFKKSRIVWRWIVDFFLTKQGQTTNKINFKGGLKP